MSHGEQARGSVKLFVELRRRLCAKVPPGSEMYRRPAISGLRWGAGYEIYYGWVMVRVGATTVWKQKGCNALVTEAGRGGNDSKSLENLLALLNSRNVNYPVPGNPPSAEVFRGLEYGRVPPHRLQYTRYRYPAWTIYTFCRINETCEYNEIPGRAL